MLNFYPGPSKIHPSVEKHIQEGLQKGLFSFNHRSEVFQKMYQETVHQLHDYLQIPQDYFVYFLSSATECWEVISQSFVATKSHHLYNGAFGEKWFQNASSLGNEVEASQFHYNQSPALPTTNADVICVTHNETSNGSLLPSHCLEATKKNNPNALIAVDATSSLGGMEIDLGLADIWFASVQKCFGLPAGLGLLICSPKAIKRGLIVDKDQHYNSFIKLHTNALKWQTTHTPNILGIYLLGKIVHELGVIKKVHAEMIEKRELLNSFFSMHSAFDFLIDNDNLRSPLTLAITHETPLSVLADAKEKNIILGKGYGEWKDNTFRIANFPAISSTEINQLIDYLKTL